VIWPPLLLKVPPLKVMLLPEAMMAVEALGLAEPALLAVSRSLVLRALFRLVLAAMVMLPLLLMVPWLFKLAVLKLMAPPE
jgi:hypothetical protein